MISADGTPRRLRGLTEQAIAAFAESGETDPNERDAGQKCLLHYADPRCLRYSVLHWACRFLIIITVPPAPIGHCYRHRAGSNYQAP